jgi:cell division protein FtsB
MRARRREINIFNMSLLDILCGALGAFCFMMLVALPYYKPPGEEKKLREAQEETNKLLRDIEKMKDRMKDQQSVEDLSELVRRLEAQIKLLQGEVNRLAAENQELKQRVEQLEQDKKQLVAENQQLRARNQELEAQNRELQTLRAENQQLQAAKKKLEQQVEGLNQALNQRQAFVVLSTTGLAGETVRIYLADNRVPEGKKEPANPDFNPEFSQGSGWAGDRVGSFPGEGISFWVTTAVTPGSIFKVYVRNDAPDFARRSFPVRTSLFGNLSNNTGIQIMPGVTLNPVRFWAFLGTIKIDDNYRPLFTPATEAEQEAEWRRLSKKQSTPTATPARSATPEASQPAALPADVAAAQQEFDAAIKELNEAMSSSGPGSDERKRKAIERFDAAQKKMLEMRKRNRGQQPQSQGPGGFPFGPPQPSPQTAVTPP